MDLDEIIKYLIWIAVFSVILAGLYFLLQKMGIL
ncbi:Uncharacterised protein [uncultured archaeon]|nr:Uncharacterised protein [uncultured archaeon]